jgi:hypothetical protein
MQEASVEGLRSISSSNNDSLQPIKEQYGGHKLRLRQ